MNELWRRLRALFRRGRLARDLEEEMQSHLEMQAEENQQNGMEPEEARYAARRQFGNVTRLREASRDAWGWRWLDTLVQDLRFALRLARRQPLFTAVAVFTLGLGIGGNTAVFSLVEAIVLRPLPYAEPGRLFMLWTVETESQRSKPSSYPDFRDWREQSRAFQAMAAFAESPLNLTSAPEPERVEALRATPGLFELLGVEPAFGRAFSSEDERVALLSHALWMRRFGGDAAIVGRAIQLDGRAYTVVGVLPPGFHFPPRRFRGAPQLFVPLAPHPDRTAWFLAVIGRLRPGATEQQARAEMDAIAARLRQAYPASNRGLGITLDPLHRYVVAPARQTVLVLLGAVGFVLLIACGNVANLLLSQGAARQREIAIRVAIGASRGRVVRQLLTESILLAALGGGLGIALAHWGLPPLAALAPERSAFFTRVHDAGVQMNSAVLAFTAAVSVLAGILFGVLPALKSTEPAGSSARGVRHGRIRGALIALELCLAFVLLAGTGLMVNSMLRLLETDLGFRTARLLKIEVSLPEAKYPEPETRAAFFQQALRRLEALPGVLSAGAITDLPLAGSFSVNQFEIQASPPRKGRALFHAVSPDYFRTMGIPLLHGRLFTGADSEQSAGVAVINRSMASRYWPNENPIGQAVVVWRGLVDRTPEGRRVRWVRQPLVIVGVAGDVRHIGRDADPRPELFMPYPQRPPGAMSIVLRTATDPAPMIPAVRKEIWRVDPDQPVYDIMTMDELVSADLALRRFVLLLIGVFGFAAVVLAAVGIYGVVSCSVRQRTQEIGIRMALGAQQRDVVRLVMRQAAAWLALGVAAGTASAAALTRLLAAHLYRVKPVDPATFTLVALALVAIALAAHAGPARRAARIHPTEALRYE